MELRSLIELECGVDRVHDDVTSGAVVDEHSTLQAAVVSRERGIFCGERIVAEFATLFPQIQFSQVLAEGASLNRGQTLVHLCGNAGRCLSIERVLLNFLSHACGVATLTRKFVEAVSFSKCKIVSTRKTLPGLRELDLAAVRAGGGINHRRSLNDGILIKDNHLALVDEVTALERARELRSPLHRIEIEVQSLDKLSSVLKIPPDVIMLDNFSPLQIRQAMAEIGNSCLVEVSGGVNLDNVREFAELGVDYISVGSITHSAPSLNLSLDVLNPDRER